MPWPCSVSSISSGSNVGWRAGAGAGGGGGGGARAEDELCSALLLESVSIGHRSFQAPKEKEDTPRKGEEPYRKQNPD